MIYVDTSFIAPLAIVEDSSEAVEEIIGRVKQGDLATSLWTKIELASIVARKVRMGDYADDKARAIRLEFLEILDESFHVITPTAADYALATQYLEIPKTGLRSGDAFHLAIAANHHAKKILTLDKTFIKVGKQLKLPVSAGIY